MQVLVDLHIRTRALQRESEILSARLDALYAAEVRNLRKLTDAVLVINSTESLGEMRRVIDESAREICGAKVAETIMTGGEDLSPLHQLAGHRWAGIGRT